MTRYVLTQEDEDWLRLLNDLAEDEDESDVVKHYGPGPHPSGTSQKAHGRGEASDVRLLDPAGFKQRWVEMIERKERRGELARPEGWTPDTLDATIDRMELGQVTPEFADAVEQAWREVASEPKMREYFAKYGRPEVVVGRKMTGGTDPGSYVAQFLGDSGETIIVYENDWTSIRHEEYYKKYGQWAFRDDYYIEETLGSGAKGLPQKVSDGLKATLRHEVGHFIQNRASAKSEIFWDKWIGLGKELGYVGEGGWGLGHDLERQFEFYKDPSMVRRTVSVYSMVNDREGFAEYFAAVTHPKYDRSAYAPEAQEILKLLETP